MALQSVLLQLPLNVILDTAGSRVNFLGGRIGFSFNVGKRAQKEQPGDLPGCSSY
jgi:hypothetical protein